MKPTLAKEKHFKVLSKKKKAEVEAEVKMMLHAHRDTLRNLYRPFNYDGTPNKKPGLDPKKVTFNCNEGYYGEAFGIMRGLQVMGYGYFGADNLHALESPYWSQDSRATIPEHNLKWWFNQIQDQVLAEENWHGNHHCDYCLKKYGKDDVRKAERWGSKSFQIRCEDEEENTNV